MKKKIPLILFLISVSIAAQDLPELNQIRSSYEAFLFRDVIERGNIILQYDSTLTDDEKIEVLTMNAVSYYSLGITDSSRIAFIDLLKINSKHKLDPILISPKVIDFFENTRRDYERITDQSQLDNLETRLSQPVYTQKFDYSLYGNSLVRSLILPGLGHLYASNWREGWFLSSAGLLSLTGMIYFIIDTNSKESEYLNETNLDLIADKYDEYNTSYKIRNTFMISYAAIWLFAQLDLIYFSDDLFQQNETFTIGMNPSHEMFSLSLRIKL